MYDKVVSILKKHGPMLSGELARRIEEEYSVSNNTARKMISRAKSPVQKQFKVSFDSNQKFIYLEEQYQSDKYHNSLFRAIKDSSQVNWICIQAFYAQSGFVSKAMLPSLVAAPVKNVKGHKRIDRVISDLIECDIIEEVDEETWGLTKWIPSFSNNYARSRGLEAIKRIIANDFKDWAAKNNLSSFGSGAVFSEKAEFGGFQWAYTAPSYVLPMYDVDNRKNGFIVADVVYGSKANKESVQFFLEKVHILRAHKRIRRFMPVLLLESADMETLQELKQNKVVVATLSNFFEPKYTEVLKDILESFSNSAAILAKNPDKIDKLLNQIVKTEGRFNGIVGDLFEIMVAYYYSRVGSFFFTMNKHIETSEARKNEIDVLVNKDGQTMIVECKATKSPIEKDFVEIWLGKNIPNIREWLLGSGRENADKQVFELWSLGGFTDDALKLLNVRANSTVKYKIVFLGRDDILKRFRDADLLNLIKMVDQYYLLK